MNPIPARLMQAQAETCPSRPRPTERERNRRAYILEAATRIFTTHGRFRVTLREIAVATGLTQISIRNQIADIDHLFALVLSKHLDAIPLRHRRHPDHRPRPFRPPPRRVPPRHPRLPQHPHAASFPMAARALLPPRGRTRTAGTTSQPARLHARRRGLAHRPPPPRQPPPRRDADRSHARRPRAHPPSTIGRDPSPELQPHPARKPRSPARARRHPPAPRPLHLPRRPRRQAHPATASHAPRDHPTRPTPNRPTPATQAARPSHLTLTGPRKARPRAKP